jgi:hypothetical protein
VNTKAVLGAKNPEGPARGNDRLATGVFFAVTGTLLLGALVVAGLHVFGWYDIPFHSPEAMQAIAGPSIGEVLLQNTPATVPPQQP